MHMYAHKFVIQVTIIYACVSYEYQCKWAWKIWFDFDYITGQTACWCAQGHNTLKNLVMYNSYITIITYIKLKSDSLVVKSSISIVSIIAIGKLFCSLIVLG